MKCSPPWQDLSVLAGVTYGALRLSAVAQNFSTSTAKLRIVQAQMVRVFPGLWDRPKKKCP